MAKPSKKQQKRKPRQRKPAQPAKTLGLPKQIKQYADFVAHPCSANPAEVPYGLRPHYKWRRSSIVHVTVPTTTTGITGGTVVNANNFTSMICIMDPYRGTMTATAYASPTDKWSAGNQSASVGKWYQQFKLNSFPIGTSGRVRVASACLRLIYSGQSSTRSGIPFAGTGMLSQNAIYRIKDGDATYTMVAYDSDTTNQADFPAAHVSPSELAGVSNVFGPGQDVEAVVDVSGVNDSMAEYKRYSSPATLWIDGADRPIAYTGLMAATPGNTYVLEAVVNYEWVPSAAGDAVSSADSNRQSPWSWDSVKTAVGRSGLTWGHAVKAGEFLLAALG
jgi:hypothetical protein